MTSITMKFILGIISLISLISIIIYSCQTEDDSEIKTSYYSEKHRPQYHFSPESGWMNDPNGMVYHEGEYHLFYQYYPNGIKWDTMHWGHAVSQDMLHWEHLPIAIYPDELGYIFSGSAVIDHNNTSGLGEDGKAPMIAIFTHHNMEGERAGRNDYQVQSIAYSLDNGMTFQKYRGNPVVSNPGIKDFRDPKVIWNDIDNQWIMVFAAYDKVRFYTSPNLIDWTFTGTFGIEGDHRLWECPDLFPLEVAGSDETKWILITSIQKEGPNGGTATSYFVGEWNGETFVGDPSDQKWLDYGTDNYAMVTWSDIPEIDGRRLGLGWMSNWQYAQEVPTKKWRSAMTLPRELKLTKYDDTYEVISIPVKEIESLVSESENISGRTFLDTQVIHDDKNTTLLNVRLSFTKNVEDLIQIRFSNDANQHISVGYRPDTR